MTAPDAPRTYAKEHLAAAAPFDCVGIARQLAVIVSDPSAEFRAPNGNPIEASLEAALERQADRRSWLRPLPPVVAGELAREILCIALEDAALEQPLNLAIARHRDDGSMSAIEVLAYGAAVALVVGVATVRVEWVKGKSLRVVKDSLDGKTIQRLLELLSQAPR